MALTADGRIVVATTHRLDANDTTDQGRLLLLDQNGRILKDVFRWTVGHPLRSLSARTTKCSRCES
jgi:hypothetical protein